MNRPDLKLVYPFAGLATLAAVSSCQHQKKEEVKPYNDRRPYSSDDELL